MKRMILALAIAAVLGGAAPALAHDASKHKGKPVEGEVISTAKDGFEIKTATGSQRVTFSSKTKFEHGTATVDASHVTKGERVKVFGTKLPSGDFVAREVLIGSTGNADHAGHAGKEGTAPKNTKKNAGKEHKQH
jgi:hypothetical protein